MPVAVPEECLWLIVICLRNDRAALHALLRTNSTLFRIAVSFLYASPFRLLQGESNRHWTVVERSKRYDSLVHLLIHSANLLPDITLSDSGASFVVSRLPRYGPEVLALPSPPTVDYLSYYTDVFHDPMLHETFMTLFPSIPNCYLANVIWYRSMVEIRNRIELAMMDRLLPQVTNLAVSMPIQVPRIKVFMMTSLRRLEVLGTDYCLLTDQDLEWEQTSHTNRTARSANGYATTRLDRMLAFIWDHQRLFGTLRELKIENKIVSPVRQPGGRLIELVEAMGDRLEVLDVQFWPGAVLYLDRIPTRQLRCLLLHTNKEPEQVFDESRDMATFLSCCPKLQELCLYSGEQDLFKAWRPERRVQNGHRQSMFPLETMSPSNFTFTEMRQMKRINIAGLAQDVIANTNEATELFASSLEVLTARSWFSGRLTTVPLSWSGTTLARLTDLDLEGEVAWTFDYASLCSCPRLCRIRLAYTGPMPSRSSRKQPAIDNLPRVFTLQDLELVGNWGTLLVRGWPAVITRIRHLERLDLTACEGISADQVYTLVLDIIEENARRCLRESNEASSGKWDTEASAVSEIYSACRLRWVIVSKRLQDNLMRQWSELRRWLDYTAGGSKGPPPLSKTLVATGSRAWEPTGLVATASLHVLASVERVRFSFMATARPSR